MNIANEKFRADAGREAEHREKKDAAWKDTQTDSGDKRGKYLQLGLLIRY